METTTRTPAHRRRVPRRAMALALVLATALTVGAIAPTGAVTSPTAHYFAQTSTWASGAPLTFVQAWDQANNRVALIKKGAPAAANIFQGHWSNTTGSSSACATCNVATVHQINKPSIAWSQSDVAQRGISDVIQPGDPAHPNPYRGYAVVTAEKAHPASGTQGQGTAEPGKGAYNDLYLMNPGGTEAWQLTDIPNAENNGIIWPRLSKDGTKLVWSQQYAGWDFWHPYTSVLGTWRIQLADITWTGGTPSLINVRSFEPESGHFYESYGFSPNGDYILYASSAGQPSLGDAQLFRIPTTLAGAPQRLSDTATTSDFFGGKWTNYNEFAFYTPDGSHIVYGRIKDSAAGGLDYWIMNADGSRQERLTYLNEPWNGGQYRNVGGWAIDPSSTDAALHVLFGACRDSGCEESDIFNLNLSTTEAGSGTGLKAEYFNDKTLAPASKVLDRTDTTVGFRFTASPGPNVPATNFSARWTGSVTPYATGSHTICVYADDGVRLWIDGTLRIDAWSDHAATQFCSPALTLNASPHTLKLEYYNAGGEGTAKLTWNVPNQNNVREVIPMGRLRPTTP